MPQVTSTCRVSDLSLNKFNQIEILIETDIKGTDEKSLETPLRSLTLPSRTVTKKESQIVVDENFFNHFLGFLYEGNQEFSMREVTKFSDLLKKISPDEMSAKGFEIAIMSATRQKIPGKLQDGKAGMIDLVCSLSKEQLT